MCQRQSLKAVRYIHENILSVSYSGKECSLAQMCVSLAVSQVSVSLQVNSIKVCVRDGAEEKVLMEGELTNKINTENSLWSLEPGKCVIVSTHTHTYTHSKRN